jgi:hypothetical protein
MAQQPGKPHPPGNPSAPPDPDKPPPVEEPPPPIPAPPVRDEPPPMQVGLRAMPGFRQRQSIFRRSGCRFAVENATKPKRSEYNPFLFDRIIL